MSQLRPEPKTPDAAPTDAPMRLGVSACLLGLNVRFDGGHKHDDFVARLGCHCEIRPAELLTPRAPSTPLPKPLAPQPLRAFRALSGGPLSTNGPLWMREILRGGKLAPP